MIGRTLSRFKTNYPILDLYKNSARSISFRKIRRVVTQYFFPAPPKPPYDHICQIGDPTLRAQAAEVNPEMITTTEFQLIIHALKQVMLKYNTIGLSAPQVGIPWRICLMQVTEDHMDQFDENARKVREMEVIPMHVFINPHVKIVDYNVLAFEECCASICGYSAIVRRAREIEVTALDETKKKFTWRVKGWAARIIQHEVDHLNGKFFTDKMDVSTFINTSWQAVNKHRGLIETRYCP